MNVKKEKMEAIWLWKDKWLTGTRDLTPAQKGHYIDMICHSDGKGLPEDARDIYQLVLPFTDNPEEIEQYKKDVHVVISKKYEFDEEKGRYFQEFQETEHSKGVDLKVKRRNARLGTNNKKNILSEQEGVQKDHKLDIDIDIDLDNIFNNIWNQLSNKRGSKQSANASWVKHAQDQKPEFLIEKYNALCSQTDDPQFIPHFSTWINQERWDEELPHKHKDRDVFDMSEEEKKLEADKIYSKIGVKKEINDE